MSKHLSRGRVALVLTLGAVGLAPISFAPTGNAGIVPAAQCGVWAAATSPAPPAPSARLMAVAVVGTNDVWVGGVYGSGDLPTTRSSSIGMGSSGRFMPLPKSGRADTTIWSMSAISSKDIWAVGWDDGTNISAGRAFHWDGKYWTEVAVPNRSDDRGNVRGDSDHTRQRLGHWSSSEGEGLIMHWNGSKWSVSFSESIDNGFTDISGGIGQRRLGGRPRAAGVSRPGICPAAPLEWIEMVIRPDQSAGHKHCRRGHKRYLGHPSKGMAKGSTFIHWNGKNTTTYTAPSSSKGIAQILGLQGDSAAEVWAVGASGTSPFYEDFYIRHAANGKYASLIEQWNGTKWSILPGGIAHSGLRSVSGSTAKGFWAVGETDSGSKPEPLVERYSACLPA